MRLCAFLQMTECHGAPSLRSLGGATGAARGRRTSEKASVDQAKKLRWLVWLVWQEVGIMLVLGSIYTSLYMSIYPQYGVLFLWVGSCESVC